MDVIIPAGAIPKPRDPLYKYTKGKPKALLDVVGELLFPARTQPDAGW